MLEEKYSGDFSFVHTFANEETRLKFLKPAEKRDPPEARTAKR